MANYNGQTVDQSHSGYKTIRQCWAWLFTENERRWNANNLPLCDLDLAAAMCGMFPSRTSKCLIHVSRARRAYNTGSWGEQPTHTSYQYGYMGGGQLCRLTPRGKVLKRK